MKRRIAGMCPISGRSNITDFEKVVRLDTEDTRNPSKNFEF